LTRLHPKIPQQVDCVRMTRKDLQQEIESLRHGEKAERIVQVQIQACSTAPVELPSIGASAQEMEASGGGREQGVGNDVNGAHRDVNVAALVAQKKAVEDVEMEAAGVGLQAVEVKHAEDLNRLEQNHENELRTLRERYDEQLRSQEQEHLKELYHFHRRDDDIAQMQEQHTYALASVEWDHQRALKAVGEQLRVLRRQNDNHHRDNKEFGNRIVELGLAQAELVHTCGRLMDAFSASNAEANQQRAEAESARASVAALQKKQLTLRDWGQVQTALHSKINELLSKLSEVTAERDAQEILYTELSTSHTVLAAQELEHRRSLQCLALRNEGLMREMVECKAVLETRCGEVEEAKSRIYQLEQALGDAVGWKNALQTSMKVDSERILSLRARADESTNALVSREDENSALREEVFHLRLDLEELRRAKNYFMEKASLTQRELDDAWKNVHELESSVSSLSHLQEKHMAQGRTGASRASAKANGDCQAFERERCQGGGARGATKQVGHQAGSHVLTHELFVGREDIEEPKAQMLEAEDEAKLSFTRLEDQQQEQLARGRGQAGARDEDIGKGQRDVAFLWEERLQQQKSMSDAERKGLEAKLQLSKELRRQLEHQVADKDAQLATMREKLVVFETLLSRKSDAERGPRSEVAQ